MNLKPIEKMNYFHISEKLVDILMTKTQNNDPLFFRVIVAYYLTTLSSTSLMAASMWSVVISSLLSTNA